MKLKIYYVERESKSQCIKYPTLGCSGTKYNIVKGKNFQPKLKFSLTSYWCWVHYPSSHPQIILLLQCTLL